MVDLVLYKTQIITWFQDENKTAEEIAQLLLELYNKSAAPRTIPLAVAIPPGQMRRFSD